MSLSLDNSELRQSAAQWVVRLRGRDVGEGDWLAFEGWLSGAPERRAAYDEAAALWGELERSAPELKAMVGDRTRVARLADRRRPRPAVLWTAVGLAAAAAAAVAFVVVPMYRTAPAQLYATAKGERRAIVLADGSQVELNGGSRMLVSFERGARKVALTDAEASFNVAHDARHPFLITAGDRTVRVVGTQFDVLHHDGRISVLVRQGTVEVDDTAGGAVRLAAGRRFRATEGATGETIEAVSADEAAGWRTGRLVYRDRPLAEVVSDLGRYFVGPIRLEGDRAGRLRFSGVLVVDREDEIISRIQDLLPISVKRIDGATIITASEEARR